MKCDDCNGGCYRPECMPALHGDPIRNAHLNNDLEGRAGRRLGMMLGGGDGLPGHDRGTPTFVKPPTDKFEARHIERQYGIKFVGDDYSGLKPKNQKAIERVNDMRKQGERI